MSALKAAHTEDVVALRGEKGWWVERCAGLEEQHRQELKELKQLHQQQQAAARAEARRAQEEAASTIAKLR